MFPTKALGPDGYPAHFFPTSLGFMWRGGNYGWDQSTERGRRYLMNK
jgi:hypothetical protein